MNETITQTAAAHVAIGTWPWNAPDKHAGKYCLELWANGGVVPRVGVYRFPAAAEKAKADVSRWLAAIAANPTMGRGVF